MHNISSQKKVFTYFVVGTVVLSITGGIIGGAVFSYTVGFLRSSGTATPVTQLFGTDDELTTIRAVESVSPSVVSIVISKDVRNFSGRTGPDLFPFDDFFDFDTFFPPFSGGDSNNENNTEEFRRQQIGGGSGFIISDDGLIVTNKHVVLDPDAFFTVILNDGRQFDAELLDIDPFNDLAVIKIDADNLPVVNLGDSDSIRIGQSVIAIGNALGEFRNTVTKGIISGIDRRVVAGDGFGTSEVIEEAIQTDAAINPGNSGGPLINLQGDVIGVNTAISRAGQLVGFAIPVNTAKRIVESVREHGRIVRPWLGVRYVLVNEKTARDNNLSVDHGALLLPGRTDGDKAVIEGSPADEAGLQEGDIILSVNGIEIKDGSSLGRIISEFQPGETVTLIIDRKGTELTFDILLGEFENG